MFSYYGSKSKIVSLYPAPDHSVVIEPFAGSARYSLRYYDRDVFLYDLSEQVVAIWHYLQEASVRDILGLPDVPSKVHIDEFTCLTQVEKDLIGFHLCRGKAKPRKVGHGQNSWSRDKVRIANDLWKIKHWHVSCADYLSIRNRKATWFIDPPYKAVNVRSNGDRYPHSVINYDDLAAWTLERKGQVIACEGAPETYLPFEPLTETNGNTNGKGVKKQREYGYVRM